MRLARGTDDEMECTTRALSETHRMWCPLPECASNEAVRDLGLLSWLIKGGSVFRRNMPLFTTELHDSAADPLPCARGVPSHAHGTRH